MKFLLILLAIANMSSSAAFEQDYQSITLAYSDYIGSWTDIAAQGYEQEIKFLPNGSSVLTGKFEDGVVQILESSLEDMIVVHDIHVFSFYVNPKTLRFRLVISGWKVNEQGTRVKRLYGTLFVYQLGQQVNGIPVTLKNQEQGSGS